MRKDRISRVTFYDRIRNLPLERVLKIRSIIQRKYEQNFQRPKLNRRHELKLNMMDGQILLYLDSICNRCKRHGTVIAGRKMVEDRFYIKKTAYMCKNCGVTWTAAEVITINTKDML